jgi:hypothetical protein
MSVIWNVALLAGVPVCWDDELMDVLIPFQYTRYGGRLNYLRQRRRLLNCAGSALPHLLYDYSLL